MREEPNHHKPPRRKFCNRRRKFATGVAFLWLLSVSPDKAPDRPSDKRKRTKKVGVSGFEPRALWFEPESPTGTGGQGGGGLGYWAQGRRAVRHPPPSCLRRGECRRGGVGRIAGPYGVSHIGGGADQEDPPAPPTKKLKSQLNPSNLKAQTAQLDAARRVSPACSYCGLQSGAPKVDSIRHLSLA